MTDLFSSITTYILGFATAIFAEPIRQKLFGPKLKLYFGDTQEYKNIVSIDRNLGILCTYLRVKVINKKRAVAKSCKAHLVNIERWDAGKNKFVASGLKDSIQLAWACKKDDEKFKGIDLAKGVNQFVEVVHAKTYEERLFPELAYIPDRYKDLFKFRGTFRYTIQVSGDKANPITIKFQFEWSGKGHNIQIK